MIVLVDQDGPLANFEIHLINAWQQAYPDRPFVAIPDRRALTAVDDYPAHFQGDVRAIYRRAGFYRSIPPVEEGLAALQELDRMGLRVFICTSPLITSEHCVPEKLAWIEFHLGRRWRERTVLTRDKTLVCGDFLIDDKPQHGVIRRPFWQLVLYDMSYNRQAELNGTPRLAADWSDWRRALHIDAPLG
ncbi:MAG: 5'-3'-deoxyribonucleotidase [Candidatus Kerfeldbacteria bacterium]|nr:5'-3'-deoxyribonucleotidase [Candidatus Kerfeldbacteria bacterium]